MAHTGLQAGGGYSCASDKVPLKLAVLTSHRVEGAATVGIALIGYFLVIGFPDTMLAGNRMQGFTQEELETVLNRIDRDRRDSKPDKLDWAKFRHHVANWELWVYGFMFLTCSAPIYVSLVVRNPSVA